MVKRRKEREIGLPKHLRILEGEIWMMGRFPNQCPPPHTHTYTGLQLVAGVIIPWGGVFFVKFVARISDVQFSAQILYFKAPSAYSSS